MGDNKRYILTKNVLYALIITLFLHCVVFIWMSFGLIFPAFSIIEKPLENEQIVELDFSDVEEQQKLNIQGENSDEKSIDKNVLRNESLEKSQYAKPRDYNDVTQDVESELKQYEQSVFDELSKSHKPIETPKTEEKPTIKHDEKAIDKSIKQTKYGRDVVTSASFYLPNRTVRIKKIPAYNCKDSGVARVLIKVSQKGRVFSAILDKSSKNAPPCIQKEALKYARKWLFSTDFSSVSKQQEGYIEFRYLAQ